MPFTLTPASRTVTEGNTDITFTVTRTTTGAQTIYASTLVGTARSADGDYTGIVDQAVTFSGNNATATFTVRVREDQLSEGTETFRVMIAAQQGQSSSQALDISEVTIEDDDQATTPTTYSLTPASRTVTEDDTEVTFTVTRSGSNLTSQTIYASTLTGTASSSGSDYTGMVDQAVSFSGSSTTATFTVRIREDQRVEGTETFRVMIAAQTGQTSSQALDTSEITITDDDQSGPATYSLTPASTTVVEGDTDITFTVTRSGNNLTSQTIYASTLIGTATSSGGDYTGIVDQAVSFSGSNTTATFTVRVREDQRVEGTETFRVMIAAQQGQNSSQALDISDVTITDDDEAGATTYSLSPSSTTVTEDDTNVTFTVTRSGSNLTSQTIYASTLFGTAASPGDYTGIVDQAVTFSGSNTTATFTVRIREDQAVEGAEAFRVMIAAQQGQGSSQALDISDVTIADDDGAAATTYSMTPTATTVVEGDTDITFTVTRSGSNLTGQTIYASTLVGTATSSGGDYAGIVDQAVVFSGSNPTATFTVRVREDQQVEATEYFRVMIAAQPGQGSSEALDISDVSITDDDRTTPITYTMTPASTRVTEGELDVTFTVTRAGSHLTSQTLYASTLFDTATSSGPDYTGFVDRAVIFNGTAATATFTVRIRDDQVVEASEHFRVMIAADKGQGSAQALDISDITIDDNDGALQTRYTVVAASTTATEGGSVTFTVTRQGNLSAETVLLSAPTDSTATFDKQDIALLDGGRPLNVPVTFRAGQDQQTITIRILNDQLVDPGEQFRVAIHRQANDGPSAYLATSNYVRISDAEGTRPQVDPVTSLVVQLRLLEIANAAEPTVGDRAFRFPVGDGTAFSEDIEDDDGYSADRGFRRPDLGIEEPPGPRHTGVDINGDQGGNGDDQEKVYSAYDGWIVYLRPEAGDDRTVRTMGGVIMINHELPDGSRYTTLYAHLENINPAIESAINEKIWIPRGTFLGDFDDIDAEPSLNDPVSGGAAFDGYPDIDFVAHLHFEVREGHQGESQRGLGYAPESYIGTKLPRNEHQIQYADISLGGSIVRFLNPMEFIAWTRKEVVQGEAPEGVADQVVAFAREGIQLLMNISADGRQVVVDNVTTAQKFLLDGIEELRVLGGALIDKIRVGALGLSSILHDTVYFDGAGGDDELEGSETDRRVVADGGEGNDRLLSGSDDDELTGGVGDDYLDGGSGLDVAVFAGTASSYNLSVAAFGSATVRAASGSSDVDTLRDIEIARFTDRSVFLGSTPFSVTNAVFNVHRLATAVGEASHVLAEIAGNVSIGRISTTQAVQQVVAAAAATTSVATLSYQFFTGKVPGLEGIDYLVSPTGPNPNNLNSAYYQTFSLENRYINFAVNLGRDGEGKAAFLAGYGALSLAEATKKAYGVIFGVTPSDAKVAALLADGRALYFEAYGRDGPSGQGTKAAMVGWLLGEAAKADLGMYARANEAFLLDLTDGATFAVDLIGVYGRPEFNFNGG